MSKTTDNLKTAFAGESQANRKYLMYAAAAEKEGLTTIAKLFRATAEAETIHSTNHFKALDGIGSTAENLQAAINGETYEFEDMYPPMLEEAIASGNKKAERAFRLAEEAEKIHAVLYKKYLECLDDPKDAEFYLCTVCGYIHENEAPESCPICKAAKKAFVNLG